MTPSRSLAFAIALVLAAAFSAVAAPPTGAWALAWSDEFDGTALNLSNWSYFTGVNQGGTNTASAVSVASGALTIKTYTSGGVHYTGWIGTHGHFDDAYGYWEARIRFNESSGEWSAFWIQPATINTVVSPPDPATYGAEIDVVEHRLQNSSGTDLSDKADINLHWNGYGAAEVSAGPGTVNNPGSTSLQGNWHTYGVRWTPSAYYFYIDGTLVNTTASGVSMRSEWIYLSTFVNGASWAGAIPSGGYGSSSATTTKMEVDYVRFYQLSERVVNGDFEAQFAPSYQVNQASLSTTGGRGGTQGVRVNPNTSAGSSIEQAIYGLVPNTDYILSGWANAAATTWAPIRLGVKNFGGAQVYQAIGSSGYTQAFVPFTTGGSNTTATIFGWEPTQWGDCYVDDFELRRAASVTNAGIEQRELGVWTSYGNTSPVTSSNAHAGGSAIKYTASTAASGAEQTIYGLTPSTAYRLTNWTKSAALSTGVKNFGGTETTTTASATSSYARSTVNFTTGASNTSATIYTWRATSGTDGYADDFFLSEPLAAPWTSQDVGSFTLNGIAGMRGSRIVAQASGNDIWGTTDHFHFIYQTLTGDGHITARVRSMEPTNDAAKVGVMMRETLNSYVRHVTVNWQPDGKVEWLRRTVGSGTSNSTLASGYASPPWTRIERRGNVFTGFTSGDGVNWTRVGSPVTLALPSTLYVGIPVCSHDESVYAEAALDNASLGAALEPGVLLTAPPAGPVTVYGLTTNLRVTAAITDDGTHGALGVAWSRVSGPGTATFASASAADTSVQFSAAGTYVLRCTATNTVGPGRDDITVNVVDTSALSLLLKLNESSGTTAADSSGSGWTGTLEGAASFAAGTISNAVNLPGASADRVTLPTGVVSACTDFTIAAWVKPDAIGTWSRVFDFGTGTTSYMFLTPRHTGTSGTVRFGIRTAAVAEQVIDGTAALTAGVWTHVAVTISGATGTLYVNGVAVGTNAAMTLNPASLGSTTLNYIGDSQWSGDPSLDGLVDDFRIYRRALTAAEIAGVASTTIAPIVSTGAAPSATSAVAAALSGSATNEMGGTLTTAWSRMSGPGTVAFTNAASPATSVTFGQAGTYVLRLSAATGVGETFSDLAVNVTANTNVFTDWIAATYPGIADVNIVGPTADPERDGSGNLMEFALGMTPNLSDATPWTPAEAGLPVGTIGSFTGIDYLCIEVRRPIGRTGITYAAEVSGDLSAWTPAVQDGTPTANGDGTENVTFRDTVASGQAGRRFIRLKITQP